MCTKGWLQLLATRQLKETVQTAAMRHGINTEEEAAEYMCWLSHGYPNYVEGTGNDKDIKSTGSDLTLMTFKIIRVGSNQEYQRLCSSMKTLGQVFISIERDNASVDTSRNQTRPRKYQRAMTGNQNRARRLQQQPQFIWNQKNPNNTVPEFRLRPGPARVWGDKSSPFICFQLFQHDALLEF